LEIHKPKAAHSVREFSIEIATIICGILIALGLEQAVDAWHWSQKVREAEASMRNELVVDDGPQAFVRVAQSPCIKSELDQLERALISERDKHSGFRAKEPTVPYFWTWDSNAFQQLTASGAHGHMGTERAYAWAAPYSLTPDLAAATQREAADFAELDGVASAPLHPSETLRERLMAAISRARADNALLTSLSERFIRYLREPGVTLTTKEQRLDLDLDHERFPNCRKIPAVG
jgi:hypothetical protein